MNWVQIYEVWKSGFRHVIIKLSDGTTVDFRPNNNVRISNHSTTILGKHVVNSYWIQTCYSDVELLARAKRLELTWVYSAFSKNCEDFKNYLLHDVKRSETREFLILAGLAAFIGITILRSA